KETARGRRSGFSSETSRLMTKGEVTREKVEESRFNPEMEDRNEWQLREHTRLAQEQKQWGQSEKKTVRHEKSLSERRRPSRTRQTGRSGCTTAS
ncbi:unnamed protein product, partial [Ascophyllum nodosum]